jgi:hypothetical protein
VLTYDNNTFIDGAFCARLVPGTFGIPAPRGLTLETKTDC